jgi:hypothetical protein
MIDTFSASLFLDSWLGIGFSMLGFLAVFAGGLAAWAWISNRTQLLEREGLAFKILRPLSFVVVVFGAGAGYFAWLSSLMHGEIQSVLLQHVGSERIVQVSFTWRGGGRSHSMLHSGVEAFTLDGESLGSRRTTGDLGGQGMAHEGQVRGADVLRGQGELLLVDPVTHRTLVEVDRALDEAFGGSDQYRIESVSPPYVVVQLEDGRTERFDMTPLVPEAVEVPSPGGSVVGSESCWAESLRDGVGFYGKPYASEALLRASLLQHPVRQQSAEFCVVDVGQPVWLALHRSTAFGDDGAHLLSALPVGSPDQPLWTTDLEPALGWWGTERYEIFSPKVRGSELCLWLVRERLSLSEVCVGVERGELRSAAVVF